MMNEVLTGFQNAEYKKQLLPEYDENPLISALPTINSPDDVANILTQSPDFSVDELNLPGYIRFHAIARLKNNFFRPSGLHISIEQKISLLLRQSYLGRNPKHPDFVKHLNNNFERVIKKDLEACIHDDVYSTASAISIVGISGVGKSTTLKRILRTYPKVTFHPKYNLLQVPWLKIDCSHDGTLSEFCLAFFAALDRRLNTEYLKKYGSSRIGIGSLIVQVANLCLIHSVGILVIDEIQHLKAAKGVGEEKMINYLVTLTNIIGVALVLVGTPKAMPLFTGKFRQARRAAADGSIVWNRIIQDDYWDEFIEGLWNFQWLRGKKPIDEAVKNKIYELSQGITSVIVTLFCLAQARIILVARRSSEEVITPKLLEVTLDEELSFVKPMLEALKNRNEQELQQYEDIDLSDIDERLIHVFDRLINSNARTPKISHFDKEKTNLLSQTIESLKAVGVNADIAKPLALEAITGNENLTLIQIVHLITGSLTKSNSIAEKKAKESKRSEVADWEQLKKPDLRKVFVDKNTSMYGALHEEGVIFNATIFGD